MVAKATRALALLQLALASAAPAQRGIPELFPAQPAGYVTDVAEALDPASVEAITAKLQRLRDATGAELAVVVLPTIGDYAPVDVAVAIGRAWGVGAGVEVGDARRNAGLVILLVPRREDDPNSGHIFIATGQGLEGIVTDGMAGRVRDLMRPQLAAGDYGPGLVTGVSALSAVIAEGFGVTDSTLVGDRAVYRGRELSPGFMLLLAFVVVIVLIVVISAARAEARNARRPGRRRRGRGPDIFFGGPGWGGGFGGHGGGWGGGGFGGFGGGGGFSGGGAGGRF